MINAAYELVKHEESAIVFENQTMVDYPELLVTALNVVIELNLTIEVCGLWIWVSGDTKPHKKTLKAAGYHWLHYKTRWYYRPAQAKSRKCFSISKEEWSMESLFRTTELMQQGVISS